MTGCSKGDSLISHKSPDLCGGLADLSIRDVALAYILLKINILQPLARLGQFPGSRWRTALIFRHTELNGRGLLCEKFKQLAGNMK